MSPMIINSGVKAYSPPLAYYVQDDFESGDVAFEWTSKFGYTVDDYANFGIPAPPGGGTKVLHINPSSGNLGIADVPPAYDFWATAHMYYTEDGIYSNFLKLTDDTNGQALGYARVYGPRNFNYRDPVLGDTRAGTLTYALNTWFKIKIHYFFDDTNGKIQAWRWDGSAWEVDLDYTGDTQQYNYTVDLIQAMNTGTNRGIVYFDEINILKEDPGDAMNFRR